MRVLWRGEQAGTFQRERATEMAAKKVKARAPFKRTAVKKVVNHVNEPDDKPVAVEEERALPGRLTKSDLAVFITKSIEIIQTLDASAREMYLVAVAYFDDEFVAHKEGERVRLQKVCRRIEAKGVNSKQMNYARLLKGCKLEYRWLVEAARQTTPEGQFLYLVYAMSQGK
ncbi:MAG TPA: hypothetical protein VFV58_02110 [Blastocatellia bacterium]|nr:hypothetical protein [Blastocatellia bacterium]